MGHRAADLAVLALADAHADPGVRALLAVQLDLHGGEVLSLDGDAAAQRVEGHVRGRAVHPHAVPAQPARRRQLQPPLQLSVVRQQQQTLGVQVKTPHGHHPRHVARQRVEHGLAAQFVVFRRDQAQGLVVQPQPRLLRLLQLLAVDGDPVGGQNVQGGTVDLLAVHADAALDDHPLGLAPAGDTGARHHLGDAVGFGAGGDLGGLAVGNLIVGHARLLRIAAGQRGVHTPKRAVWEAFLSPACAPRGGLRQDGHGPLHHPYGACPVPSP